MARGFYLESVWSPDGERNVLSKVMVFCRRNDGPFKISVVDLLKRVLRMLLPVLVFSGIALAQVSVTTEGYDNPRTGANLHESVLNTLNVNTQQFGKLFSQPVDDEQHRWR